MISQAKLHRFARCCVIAVAAATVWIAVASFPYDVDRPLSAAELDESRRYYAEAYAKGAPAAGQPASDFESRYTRIAAAAARADRVEERVSNFVSTYGLRGGAVLDVGSGRGYLQDVARNYTGLDISSSVGRFYHKKFVLGSATAMPFPDNSFDGGWSIWVLEHVPNPEQALLEIRRVMKDGAAFFLYPTWHCNSWAAEGYGVRPYSDFGWRGKLIKASIPFRLSLPFRLAARVPARSARNLASRFGPTRLHYRLLQPNYQHYWVPDSDALNDIDRYEAMLWFRSRGDQCLNCEGDSGSPIMRGYVPLIVRIHK